jgi:F-type H+-transporting ATPase subunit gamma
MAEHAFVGGFNERLLNTAETDRDACNALFVLGSRGATLALERNQQIVWTHPMATRLESVPETVRHLTAELFRLIARRDVIRADVMFTRYRQGTAATIERRRLFPLNLAPLAAKQARLPPLHNLPPQALLEKLLAEYISALLTEAAVESLASENAARFSAMDSAHDNVSKKLDQLREEARQARQSEITTDLIDLITGAEALQSVEANPRK